MTRVLSALVLIALVGSVLWLSPWWAVLVLAATVAALGAYELAGLSRAVGAPVPVLVVSCAAVATCAAVPIGFGSGDALLVVVFALVVTTGVVTLAGGAPSPSTMTRAAMTLMTPIYLGVPLGAMAWMHLIYGPRVVTFLIATIVVSDSTQYFVGRAFGRHKLAPAVSPAKTVEGAVGGIVAAAAVGASLGPLWGQAASMAEGLTLGVVLCLAGIVGDLFESMLKRGAGVKDSSTMIPGHGGVLDRIDAYLFAVPFYALFLRYVG
ncbi:MAG: phosphatidate cytidylyltransferase [Acidobacteria bacterium]|nr:phosphatidate cytidylyltransferase [Acidobacteriota bacterium]